METETWFRFSGNDPSLERSIAAALAAAGIRVMPAENAIANRHGIFAIDQVSDSALQFLQSISSTSSGRILVLAAGQSAQDRSGCWRLLQAGASDVLLWTDSKMGRQIKARLDRWRAIDELTESPGVCELLVGQSPVWRGLIRRVVEAARFTRAPVLLIGESGTGKELIARVVHQLDARNINHRSNEIVTVDCTTIVPELSGSELFGHERGAFTGATQARDGAFALANGGTLFLDEIGELPLSLQAQLLRAVQEKTFKRVGSNFWQMTDFRLVSATNRDLTDLAARREFRLDLYYRIAGVVCRVPPLRERSEDIPVLARHFLQSIVHGPAEFDTHVEEYLSHRAYPGNVRDLRQLVERIAHRHVGTGAVTIGDIPEEDRPGGDELPQGWPEKLEKAITFAISRHAGLKEINQLAAETAIRAAVAAEGGNLQRAAKRLGVTDRALQMRRASGAFHT